jgi:ACS family hexuronate transporter-like MFS transporter
MILSDLHLNNEEFGRLLAAFRWAYALAHIPAGFLADRFVIRSIYALAVGVWSLAGAGSAATGTFRQLGIMRGALGIGEAFNWPCATRVVANMFPPSDRGLASGFFNSGAAIGSLAGPFIITPIAVLYGWRWAFFDVGALGACWIALWLFETRKGTSAQSIVGSRSAMTPLGRPVPQPGVRKRRARPIMLDPAFWALVTVAITINPCWYFLNEWIPSYMHAQRRMGYMAAGLVTIPMFLGADFGNIASGGLVKMLTARKWLLRRARGFTLTIATLLILPVAFLTEVRSVTLAIALLAIACIGVTSIIANYTACQQDFCFTNVGLVAGILGMTSNVCSALVNPEIGRYVDRTGSYQLVFILVAVLSVASLAAIILFDRLVHISD